MPCSAALDGLRGWERSEVQPGVSEHNRDVTEPEGCGLNRRSTACWHVTTEAPWCCRAECDSHCPHRARAGWQGSALQSPWVAAMEVPFRAPGEPVTELTSGPSGHLSGCHHVAQRPCFSRLLRQCPTQASSMGKPCSAYSAACAPWSERFPLSPSFLLSRRHRCRTCTLA